MANFENLGSFYTENKTILKDYLETKLEIYRLQGIKVFSKSAGYMIWVIIAAFFFFLFIIFAGITLGFWLSNVTGSNIAGFGITAGIIVLLMVFLTLLRKVLFINPIIRTIIRHSSKED
jgi:hypothetical protein